MATHIHIYTTRDRALRRDASPGSLENKLIHHIGQAKEFRKEAARLISEAASKTGRAKSKLLESAEKFSAAAKHHEDERDKLIRAGVKEE